MRDFGQRSGQLIRGDATELIVLRNPRRTGFGATRTLQFFFARDNAQVGPLNVVHYNGPQTDSVICANTNGRNVLKHQRVRDTCDRFKPNTAFFFKLFFVD